MVYFLTNSSTKKQNLIFLLIAFLLIISIEPHLTIKQLNEAIKKSFYKPYCINCQQQVQPNVAFNKKLEAKFYEWIQCVQGEPSYVFVDDLQCFTQTCYPNYALAYEDIQLGKQQIKLLQKILEKSRLVNSKGIQILKASKRMKAVGQWEIWVVWQYNETLLESIYERKQKKVSVIQEEPSDWTLKKQVNYLKKGKQKVINKEEIEKLEVVLRKLNVIKKGQNVIRVLKEQLNFRFLISRNFPSNKIQQLKEVGARLSGNMRKEPQKNEGRILYNITETQNIIKRVQTFLQSYFQIISTKLTLLRIDNENMKEETVYSLTYSSQPNAQQSSFYENPIPYILYVEFEFDPIKEQPQVLKVSKLFLKKQMQNSKDTGQANIQFKVINKTYKPKQFENLILPETSNPSSDPFPSNIVLVQYSNVIQFIRTKVYKSIQAYLINFYYEEYFSTDMISASVGENELIYLICIVLKKYIPGQPNNYFTFKIDKKTERLELVRFNSVVAKDRVKLYEKSLQNSNPVDSNEQIYLRIIKAIQKNPLYTKQLILFEILVLKLKSYQTEQIYEYMIKYFYQEDVNPNIQYIEFRHLASINRNKPSGSIRAISIQIVSTVLSPRQRLKSVYNSQKDGQTKIEIANGVIEEKSFANNKILEPYLQIIYLIKADVLKEINNFTLVSIAQSSQNPNKYYITVQYKASHKYFRIEIQANTFTGTTEVMFIKELSSLQQKSITKDSLFSDCSVMAKLDSSYFIHFSIIFSVQKLPFSYLKPIIAPSFRFVCPERTSLTVKQAEGLILNTFLAGQGEKVVCQSQEMKEVEGKEVYNVKCRVGKKKFKAEEVRDFNATIILKGGRGHTDQNKLTKLLDMQQESISINPILKLTDAMYLMFNY